MHHLRNMWTDSCGFISEVCHLKYLAAGLRVSAAAGKNQCDYDAIGLHLSPMPWPGRRHHSQIMMRCQ